MEIERDVVPDGLPYYDEIRLRLADAVSATLDRDWDLIALGCHEQAIAHRIAVYLERHFPSFHTDCEYNRRKHKSKDLCPETPGESTKMRPDIIVHRRDTSDNVLAVEMKANANRSKSNDLEKLKRLKSEEAYLYKGVAFVRIHNAVADIADGKLRATISWYDVLDRNIVERNDERQEFESTSHEEEVKLVWQQRGGRARGRKSRRPTKH